jgi:hypothetical protein
VRGAQVYPGVHIDTAHVVAALAPPAPQITPKPSGPLPADLSTARPGDPPASKLGERPPEASGDAAAGKSDSASDPKLASITPQPAGDAASVPGLEPQERPHTEAPADVAAPSAVQGLEPTGAIGFSAVPRPPADPGTAGHPA